GQATYTGIVTAQKFVGDGSGLTGITASGTGIVIKHDGSTVGTAGTINFGTNLDVSAISGGAVTITASGGSGSGISTISGVVNIVNDLDVDGHTNLDNVSIAGVTTITNSGGLADFKAIELEKSGTSGASRINFLENGTIRGGLTYSHDNNRIELISENGESIRFQDKANNQFGLINSSGLTLNGDLDVDGHTNLDNVSIAGVTTITSSSQYPLIINSTDNAKIALQGSSNPYIYFREGTTDKGYIQWHSDGDFRFGNSESGEILKIKSGADGLTFTHDGTESKVFHAGNDGSGSTLDADLLDGQEGSYYSPNVGIT
ncbi:MAG: hypothetical protein VXY93_12935, partial [Pseudomonadota bacterium]|nr:hypothetical protein [Pseudomonadota bacterium]